jgi:hypothetical protein
VAIKLLGNLNEQWLLFARQQGGEESKECSLAGLTSNREAHDKCEAKRKASQVSRQRWQEETNVGVSMTAIETQWLTVDGRRRMVDG